MIGPEPLRPEGLKRPWQPGLPRQRWQLPPPQWQLPETSVPVERRQGGLPPVCGLELEGKG